MDLDPLENRREALPTDSLIPGIAFPFGRPRILLVDDTPASLLALEAVLEPLGAQLVRAASGQEALDKASLYEFAVILLDVQMPGLDGFQTAFRIREKIRGRHTPIIFLTATDLEERQILRGYAAGAVDFLGKPFLPEVLRGKVRVFLDLYDSNRRLLQAERRLRRLTQMLERRVEERTAELEESERRSRILAAISAALADSLEFRTVIRKVASVPVPEYAHWCTLHALDDRGTVSVVAAARSDPDGTASVTVDHLSPGEPVPAHVRQVLESGRARSRPEVMTIPIRARGRLLGAVTLGAPPEGRAFGPADLQFAEELARRAAAAMENALLYHAAQEEIVLRRRAEELARKSKLELADFCENAPVPLHWLGPDGTILWANQAELDLLGYAREEYVGHSVVEFHADRETADDFLRRLSANETLHDFPARLTCRDGSVRDVLISSNVLWDEGRFIHTRCFTRDVTERKRLLNALAHGAYHDALTGLPNRVAFYEQLQKSLARAERRPAYGFAVLFLDLDRFKQVNDTLGHCAGDELLARVASRLRACLRPGDTAARLGGDEFTILLDDISDPASAITVAERILAELSRTYQIAGRDVVVTPSLGITLRSPAHRQPEDLIRDADSAMYAAKNQGGCCWKLRCRIEYEQPTSL